MPRCRVACVKSHKLTRGPATGRNLRGWELGMEAFFGKLTSDLVRSGGPQVASACRLGRVSC
jgi:hypothetical protein